MDKYSKYLLTLLLLGLGAYLKSPLVCISPVILWGLAYANEAFTFKNKDKEVAALQEEVLKLKAKTTSIEKDIMNVADRFKTVLGETYQ